MKVADILRENSHVFNRLPVNSSGYSGRLVSNLDGKYLVRFDNEFMDHTPKTAAEAVDQITGYLTTNFPEVRLPLKFFANTNNNNIDIGDVTGEYMSAEIVQLPDR